MSEKLRWKIADLVNRVFHRRQCWADLVSWVLRDRRDNAGAGLMARLPWAPIEETCFKDAERAGRCYCGKVGPDGVVLRTGEKVCVTRVPGGDGNRLCSRPDGHDGLHQCGGVEWGSA